MPFTEADLFPGTSPLRRTGFSEREVVTNLADSMEASGYQWSDEVRPQEFSSQVALTTKSAALRARAELFNNKRKAAAMGMSRDLAEYSKEAQDKNISSAWESVADLLSIGNYTVAGAALTYARTGSVYDAFRQAASEFTNALPVLDQDTVKRLGLPEAKRETFSQGLPTLLHKEAVKSDRWAATGVGLVLDIFADPTTYIMPGKAIRTLAATRGGEAFTRLVKGATAPLREAEWVENSSRWLGRAFVPYYDIKQAEKRGISLEGVEHLVQGADKFKGGKGIADNYSLGVALARAHMQGEARNVEEQVYRLLANTTEGEQLFLGSFLDQPDMLAKYLHEMADAGGIARERVPEILSKAKEANRILKGYAEKEVKSGILDPAIVRENYVYGTAPVNQRSDRMFDQFLKERGIDRELAPWEEAEKQVLFESTTPGFRKAKTFQHIEDRINAGIPTELNVGLMVAKRGFRSAQVQATQTLHQSVLSNPEMALRVTEDIGEDGWKLLNKRGLKEFTVPFSPTGQKMTYAVPTEVADALNRYTNKWKNPEEIKDFFKVTDWLTSMWKGMAVFSPGFHIRNIMGQVFQDWGAGIGKPIQKGESFLSVENLPAPLLKAVHALTGKRDLYTANYFKLRGAAMGITGGPDSVFSKEMMGLSPGELAQSLKIHEGANFQGKILSVDELRDEVQKFGILDNGWSGSDAVTDLQKAGLKGLQAQQTQGQFWQALSSRVTGEAAPALPKATGAGASNPLAQFTIGQTGEKSLAEAAAPWLGTENPLYRGNRAIGRFLENNARVAHYLDRRLRGWSPEKARQSTVKWHFDYSELTDFEQQVMRRVLPFYSWSRKNMPLMFEAIASNPGRYAYIPKVKTAIEALSPEWANIDTPDYFKETQAVRLPFAKDKQPVFWQPELPFLDVNRANLRDIAAGAHPVLGVAYEYLSGKSLFTGSPIERYEGELAKGALGRLGVSKEQQYFAGKLLPTAGLIDRSFLRGEDEVSLEPTGFATLQFGGLKLKPLDVHKTRLDKIFKGMRSSRDFMQKVREERARRRIWEQADEEE